MKKFLKLRHELVPYIYSMNYRAAVEDEPLIQPLYYNWAVQEAYLFKNEYSFGSEMIVAPITQPQDKETMCGSVIMYFPEGEWYDFFSGVRYTGGRTLTIYRDIKNMPVFVKAGGIIPMAQLEHVNDIENPQKMTIRVYAGTGNVFELYEDDGISNEYLNVKYAITKMKLDWSESPVFTIEAPRGDASVIPQNRTYQMVFIGIEYTENIIVTEDGVIRNVKVSKGEVGEICVVAEEVRGRLEVYFDAPVSIRKNNISNLLADFLEKAQTNNMPESYAQEEAFMVAQYAAKFKDRLYANMIDPKTCVADKLTQLIQMDISDNMRKAVTEISTSDRI